jgi:glycosyltransferase involved in cell wall biosynthesis
MNGTARTVPMVSVVVPTYNSQRTLEACLHSIEDQTCNELEVIIADSHSIDGTIKIARRHNLKIVQTHWKLLGARYKGFIESTGRFVLMLDSDQILEKTAIERSLRMMNQGYDMVCLGESTYKIETWIQHLFEIDRQLVHKEAGAHLDPLEGVLLARFYKREILEEAFRRIPAILFEKAVAHDHAIIYYEAYRLSKKVAIVNKSVWHIEPRSLKELWNKNFRYGKSTYEIVRSGYYGNLLKRKQRFRKISWNNLALNFQSNLLLTMKAIPYALGYMVQGISHSLNER